MKWIKIGPKRIEISDLLMIFFCCIPFINVGFFFGYYAKLYAVVFGLIMLVFARIKKSNYMNRSRISNVLLIYLAISMVILNFPTSIEFFLLVACGILLASFKMEDDSLEMIETIIIFIGIFYALSVYLQFIAPGIYKSILRVLVDEGVYQQALDGPIIYGDYPGFAFESNRAGLCIAPAVAITFARLLLRDKTHVGNELITNIVIFVITYGSLVLIGRRAFILFFPTALLLIALYVLFHKKSKWAKFIGIYVILGVVLCSFFIFDEILLILSNNSGSGIDLSKREIYWGLAFEMFHKNPLFGTGMRTYDIFYENMAHRNLAFAGAHNSYIQLLGEIGIVGVILFFGMVLVFLKRSIKGLLICLKNKNTIYAQRIVVSLIMQILFILLAISESAFIAPYSSILYFLMVNMATNTLYKLKQ